MSGVMTCFPAFLILALVVFFVVEQFVDQAMANIEA